MRRARPQSNGKGPRGNTTNTAGKPPTSNNNNNKNNNNNNNDLGFGKKKADIERIDSDGSDLDEVDVGLAGAATGIKNIKRQRTEMQATTEEELVALNETVEEKRRRLAREYLAAVGMDNVDDDEEEELLVEGTDDDDEEEDGEAYKFDPIARALKQQALRVQGKEKRSSLVKEMYDLKTTDFYKGEVKYTPLEHNAHNTGQQKIPLLSHIQPTWITAGHRWFITALDLADDNTFAVTGSHDGSLVRYDIVTGVKQNINLGRAKNQKGHKGAVNAVSISSDNIYLATGGDDKTVRIWDLRSNQQVHLWDKHTDRVNCVKFKKDSLNLFSAGYDRNVNCYDCEKFTFMETLYGHTYPVFGMDALYQNKVFTSGGDTSLRVWKLETDSQAVLEGNKNQFSMDCLTAIDHDTFVTGSQGNLLQLWSANKKKPLDTIYDAHNGVTMARLGTRKFGDQQQTLEHPVENWVTSLTSVYSSDVVFSGSSDGYIRAWKASLEHNQLQALYNIPVKGYVNQLKVGANGRFLLAAVGKNHRLGSWTGHINEGVKEGLYLYDLTTLYPAQTAQDKEYAMDDDADYVLDVDEASD